MASAKEYHASLLAVALAADTFISSYELSFPSKVYQDLTKAIAYWKQLELERRNQEKGS